MKSTKKNKYEKKKCELCKIKINKQIYYGHNKTFCNELCRNKYMNMNENWNKKYQSQNSNNSKKIIKKIIKMGIRNIKIPIIQKKI